MPANSSEIKNGKGNIISGYGCLWKVFKLFGIDVESPSKCMREYTQRLYIYYSFGFFGFLSLCAAYSTTSMWAKTTNISTGLKISFPVTLSNVLSTVLWIVLYKQRSYLQITLVRMHSEAYPRFDKIRAINATLYSFCFFHIFYMLAWSFLMNETSEDMYYQLLLGYKLGNSCRIFANFLFLFAYCINVVFFPSLVAIALTSIYLHCKFLLSEYEQKIKSMSQCIVYAPVKLIRHYSRLLEVVGELNGILSTPAFLVFILLSLEMFSCMAVVLLFDFDQKNIQRVFSSLVILTHNAIVFLWMVLIASSVPAKMKVIRNHFSSMFESLLYSSESDRDKLAIIRHAMSKETVSFSACGMVKFSRKFILSFFGGFLTYALLFININNNR